jgi:16S rRNA (cytosine967-C5)-methyltransferase
MATEARRIAFQILKAVEQGGATLAELLAQPAAERLEPRDRAFLHELVLGTLRHQGALDHSLAVQVDRPLEQLDPDVLIGLRLGASQLLRLRVPARAAVSESVDLVKERAPRASGLVNAVLRRLARDGPRPALDPSTDPLAWLTTAGSLPRWLAERWIASLGPEVAVARATALLEAPITSFRLNPRIGDAEGRVQAAGLDPRPLTVRGSWTCSSGSGAVALASEGLIYIQDQGAQMVAQLAAAEGLVLDACAAPGGKAMLMADMHPTTARVVAAEASSRRLATLADRVRAWGARNVLVIGADALRPPLHRRFHSVLLDAPCSGLGTLSRHPDIRWRASARDLAGHSRRQREMLEALAPLVLPAGRLVYATCSSEPEENEDVMRSFLDAHPEFAPAALPAWALRFVDGPFARTRPERDGGDSFFAAVLART